MLSRNNLQQIEMNYCTFKLLSNYKTILLYTLYITFVFHKKWVIHTALSQHVNLKYILLDFVRHYYNIIKVLIYEVEIIFLNFLLKYIFRLRFGLMNSVINYLRLKIHVNI